MWAKIKNWTFNGHVFIDSGNPDINLEGHEVRITGLEDKRIKEMMIQDHGKEIFWMVQSDGWIIVLRRDPAASRLYFLIRFKIERNTEVQKEFFSTDLKWVPEPSPGHIPSNALRIPLFERKK